MKELRALKFPIQLVDGRLPVAVFLPVFFMLLVFNFYLKCVPAFKKKKKRFFLLLEVELLLQLLLSYMS